MSNDVQLIRAIMLNNGVRGSYLMKHSNAVQRCIQFELNFYEFMGLHETAICSVTGLKLEHTQKAPRKHQHSIDRIDPAGPYSAKNCVVMSAMANGVKERLDSFLQDNQLNDEQKLKMLYKAEYILRKRIKEKADVQID